MALTWPPERSKAPKKRDDLCLQTLDDELLVYDPQGDRVHALTPQAALVLELCDGIRTLEEVDHKLTQTFEVEDPSLLREHVFSELDRAHLLEESDPTIADTRMARRTLLKSLGTAALLVPAVTSITAPAAAQAGSCAGLLQLALGRPCCPGLQINILGLCISLFPGGSSAGSRSAMPLRRPPTR